MACPCEDEVICSICNACTTECTCTPADYDNDGCERTYPTDCSTYSGSDVACMNIQRGSILTVVLLRIINFLLGVLSRVTSNSLQVSTSGNCNENLQIEIVPSTNDGNIFRLGSDGRPYVPTINIEDTPCVTWTKLIKNSEIRFIPTFDFSCFCDRCDDSPCSTPSDLTATIN